MGCYRQNYNLRLTRFVSAGKIPPQKLFRGLFSASTFVDGAEFTFLHQALNFASFEQSPASTLDSGKSAVFKSSVNSTAGKAVLLDSLLNGEVISLGLSFDFGHCRFHRLSHNGGNQILKEGPDRIQIIHTVVTKKLNKQLWPPLYQRASLTPQKYSGKLWESNTRNCRFAFCRTTQNALLPLPKAAGQDNPELDFAVFSEVIYLFSRSSERVKNWRYIVRAEVEVCAIAAVIQISAAAVPCGENERLVH